MDNQYPYFLIVDDDLDDHYFLTRALKNVFDKPRILSVFDGTHAREYIEASRETNLKPDLIFLDLRLGGISTIEYIGRLKKDTWLRRVPIIVLAGRRAETDPDELLKLGVDAVYMKPHSLPAIEAIVLEIKERWFASRSNS